MIDTGLHGFFPVAGRSSCWLFVYFYSVLFVPCIQMRLFNDLELVQGKVLWVRRCFPARVVKFLNPFLDVCTPFCLVIES